MEIETIDTLAHSISEYGVLIIIAAVFIIATVFMARFFVTDLRNSVNNILEKLSEVAETMTDIADGLRPMSELRIKNTMSTYFANALNQCCDIVERVLTENHIVDRDATRNKIRVLVTRLHNTRNSHFDHIPYKGRMLSSFTAPEWVDSVTDAIMIEVYSSHAQDRAKVKANLQDVYETIKYDFYKRLK